MSAFAVMQNMRQQTQMSAAAFDTALLTSAKRSNADSDLLGSTRFGFSKLELEQLFSGEPEEHLTSTTASSSHSSPVVRSVTSRRPASRMSVERDRHGAHAAGAVLLINSISREIPRGDASREGSAHGETEVPLLSPSNREKYAAVLPQSDGTPIGVLRAIHMEALLHADMVEIPPSQMSVAGNGGKLKRGRHTWVPPATRDSPPQQPRGPGDGVKDSAPGSWGVQPTEDLQILRRHSADNILGPGSASNDRGGKYDCGETSSATESAAEYAAAAAAAELSSSHPNPKPLIKIDVTTASSDMDDLPWSPGFGAHNACGGSAFQDNEDDEASGLCHSTAFCKALDRLPTIPPSHPLKQAWDWTIIVLVLYVAVIVPFQATFLIDTPPGMEEVPSFDNMAIFDVAVDCAFIADIFVSFSTAVQLRDGTLLTSHAVIAHTYLRSFFFIDLVSSVPVDWFITSSANVGLLAVVKCLRLLRIGRLMKKLDQLPGANLFRVVKLLLFFVIITHWVACLWYLSAVLGDGETWVTVQAVDLSDLGGDVSMMSLGYWYMMSVYWSLTTLTTVGYGDITPVSQGEVLYTIFAQFVGIMVSAVITGQVAVLLAAYEAAYGRYQHRIELFRAFVDINPLPATLSQRMLRCIDHFFEKDQGLEADDVLGQVSPALKLEIMLDRVGGIVSSCHLFRSAPEGLVAALVNSLTHEPYYTGDYVVRKGDPARKLYFVYAGVLEVFIPSVDKRLSLDRISEEGGIDEHTQLRTGDNFGALEMATAPGVYEHHVRVKDPAELWVLTAKELVRCVALFPDFAKGFHHRMRREITV